MRREGKPRRFLVRLCSEEHNVGDDVRKKVETPSNFLCLSQLFSFSFYLEVKR